MSIIAQSGSTPSRSASAPLAHGGFFAYHGLWAPGVRLFRSMNFAWKAMIISTAFVVPMVGLLVWQIFNQYDVTLQERKDTTRQHVEIALGFVQWAQAQQASGKLDQRQAQDLAIHSIESLRYGADNYFWITDMQPRMIMHPFKPQLDGQDVSGVKDPGGLALFSAMADVVRRDGRGYVSYQWPRPGGHRAVDKVSYVAGFAPWGWIVGSGVYVDDIRDALHAELLHLGMVVGSTLLVAGYLFLSFYRVMNGGLKETSRHLHAMTDGNLTTSPKPWGRDEPAELMS